MHADEREEGRDRVQVQGTERHGIEVRRGQTEHIKVELG